MRKKYSSEFKARVALSAIREQKTLSELSSEHGIHRMVIQNWKRQAINALPEIFTKAKASPRKEDREKLIESLHCEIGKLKIERDWLKKKSEDFNV